jgi:hypothetical protein
MNETSSHPPSVDPVRERLQRISDECLQLCGACLGAPGFFECQCPSQGMLQTRLVQSVAALTAVLDRCAQLQQFGYGSASDYDKGGLRAANEVRAAIAAGLGATP